jgi:hypothetical protein
MTLCIAGEFWRNLALHGSKCLTFDAFLEEVGALVLIEGSVVTI